MSKKLAIRGHSTRGKEVIELLEMLGGKNIRNFDGTANMYSYYLIDNLIEILSDAEDNEFIIYELEEFLEKYPFKVGDVIKFPNGMAEEIAEMKWNEESEDIIYRSVSGVERPCHLPKNTNNKTNTKTDCKKCGLHYGSVQYFDKDYPNNTSKDMEENKVDLTLKGELYHGNRISYQIPDGYEVSKIENGEIILQKKKPKYHKTYEECCKLLSLGEDGKLYTKGYKASLIQNFQKLLICRNAYWKIAGEEMCLGKPWEPDWTNNYQKKWIINFYQGEINFTTGPNVQFILAFPTPETRDAFYENFKNEIEQCKELL